MFVYVYVLFPGGNAEEPNLTEYQSWKPGPV